MNLVNRRKKYYININDKLTRLLFVYLVISQNEIELKNVLIGQKKLSNKNIDYIRFEQTLLIPQ